jgi:hypothetical protein
MNEVLGGKVPAVRGGDVGAFDRITMDRFRPGSTACTSCVSGGGRLAALNTEVDLGGLKTVALLKAALTGTPSCADRCSFQRDRSRGRALEVVESVDA